MPLRNGYSINSTHADGSEDDEPLIESDAVPPQCCSTRLNLAILMFFGFSVVYGLRVNLSVAMVAMVNDTDPQPAPNSSVYKTCPLPPGTDNTSDSFRQPEGIPQYPWDSETQGWLLGAFFFGYLCTQIPGGYLSGHYGGSIFLGLGVLCTAVLTLLTPLAAQLGSGWLFALRALEGFGEGTGHGWSVPLLSMLLSVPLWAIIVTQMCSNWSYYTLLTSLPTYMNKIMHFDLKSNGFLSALPYLGAWLFATLSGVVADLLIEREVFSVTAVRKIFTLTGLLPGSACLVAVGYAGCSHILTVIFLTLTSTIGGMSASGVFINQIDIAPRYAGFLLGITNTFGTIPGVVAPIVTGYFTEDHTLAGWKKVFWVAAGINVGGALFYTIFGSGKIQPWALTEEERAEAEKKRDTSYLHMKYKGTAGTLKYQNICSIQT
ncbi:Sialin H(+)/nitrate cotransporter H(+)/sialic acid cotransporter [Collichthys lucidus]|uniref:Sialin H(+)/nitrate cotransporter H(+)/sialic acid cotransporter n=1 Tax=Collichthys lucidus TaxID=240159 RepID=A0A4U5VLW8_COLLU|nr:Sialin H(+)/nitrate cotransporter H(+)/sialic acid cotransporter [Collichthys lucidus]